jgi:hypothetical protein
VEPPKDIGDRSTLAIILSLRSVGYGVLLPFGENTRYDLVIEEGGSFSRVQCKTGRLREGSIRFPVCSCYGHHRNPVEARRSYHGQIDSFAVFCPETGGVYLIPVEKLPARSLAHLRVDPPLNNQRKRVRYAADFEIGELPWNRLGGDVADDVTLCPPATWLHSSATAGLRGPSDAR